MAMALLVAICVTFGLYFGGFTEYSLLYIWPIAQSMWSMAGEGRLRLPQ